jgi:opacity protein-like surface antigen
MKKSTLLAAVAALAVAGSAQAQFGPTSPFAVEVRAGFTIPNGELADLADSGVGLNANASFAFMPMLSAYAGYSFNQFPVSEFEGEEIDGDWTDTGIDAGLRVGLSVPGLPVAPFINGGISYHKLELELDDFPGENFETDSELGFHVGGGFELPLGPRLSVTPAVSYTQYDVEDDDEPVSFLKLDVGLRFRI